MTKNTVSRMGLLVCTALASSGLMAGECWAQAASKEPALEEIVVTAQKREQNQQDVPISLTAVTSKSLEANRITSVIDLGAAVPNMAARNVAGGAMLPAFTMRGVTSYGVVPGSDKEISIYVDGVYMGSATGAALDLPDTERIEVLRGPQGTLFGRNATAGAVSVTTTDPSGHFGIKQDFTYGNYKQFRSKTRVDLGSFGDFSATVSFLHDERRGDIKNLGAGTVWTVPAGLGIPTSQVSVPYLGSKNLNSVFVAIKYEPNADFKVVNKFDWTGNHFTAAGAAPVGVYPAALGPFAGFLSAVLATQTTPPVYDTTATRPEAVNNAFTTPSYSKAWGDSLTATYTATDHLSFKNIMAYRETYVNASEQMDGLGGLTITPALAGLIPSLAPVVGSPFCVFCIEQISTSKQFSDELQANYNSQPLTVTAGLLYFHLNTVNGGRPGYPQNIALSVVPFGNTGLISPAVHSTATNKATSLAAYIQAEGHITPQLDVIGGFRVTNDKKSGQWDGATIIPFTYNQTKPSFSVGLNYKPNRDVLLYAKYSSAFVSGGVSGDFAFAPETAKSWEAGIKSDWFDHRVRANLAVYDVRYSHLQTAQSGVNVGSKTALVVVDLGNVHAKGFEFESTIVPADGVTLGAALGYTDVKYTYINPNSGLGALGVAATLSNFLPTLQPKWTTNLSVEYVTPPVLGDAKLSFRIDASWHNKVLLDSYTTYWSIPQYAALTYQQATWLVNTRVSLDHVKLPVGEGQIAFWVKNLNNAKQPVFMDILGGFAGNAEFQAARTLGVDLTFKY